MDWSTIVVAGLALIGTLAGSYLGNNKTMAVMDEKLRSLEGKFRTLEDKVMEHNHVVERTAIVEQSLKTAWKQIDEIKDKMKP